MLNPVSLPEESSNLGVSLKNPPLPPERTNASPWVPARQRVQMSDMIASVMENHFEILISQFSPTADPAAWAVGGEGEKEQMEKKKQMRSRVNSEHPFPLCRS